MAGSDQELWTTHFSTPTFHRLHRLFALSSRCLLPPRSRRKYFKTVRWDISLFLFYDTGMACEPPLPE